MKPSQHAKPRYVQSLNLLSERTPMTDITVWLLKLTRALSVTRVSRVTRVTVNKKSVSLCDVLMFTNYEIAKVNVIQFSTSSSNANYMKTTLYKFFLPLGI